MKWLDEYNIGIEEIDNQHKDLLKNLTQLKQSFSKEEDAVKTLKFLVDYTDSHFLKEEEFMQQISYPDYADHKKIHEKLTSKVLELVAGSKQGKGLDVAYLLRFLTEWLITHILDEDSRIGVFYRKKNN